MLTKSDSVLGCVELFGQTGVAQLAFQINTIGVRQKNGKRTIFQCRMLEILLVRLVCIEQQQDELTIVPTVNAVLFQQLSE